LESEQEVMKRQVRVYITSHSSFLTLFILLTSRLSSFSSFSFLLILILAVLCNTFTRGEFWSIALDFAMITVHIIKLHCRLSVRETVQLSHGRRMGWFARSHTCYTANAYWRYSVFCCFFVIFTAFIVIKSKDSMAVSCVIFNWYRLVTTVTKRKVSSEYRVKRILDSKRDLYNLLIRCRLYTKLLRVCFT